MPGGRPRGGRRNGKARTAYKNRADLNGGKMPVEAAPGQAYGEAKAQMDAQRAVPMGTPEVAPPAFAGRPETMAAPGSLGDLFADSTEPGEHVMSGATMGPGAGPDAFGFGPGHVDPADLDKALRWLPALEEIANRPGSTAATRNVVRMLKARVSMVNTPGVR